ncbi:hypothetical protein [Sporosarcina highlanderae]|uniref:Uncharacterized protein n=1 Tax=Sporosarcina highlanderae TaxID=3035916 RepID=A0ABT8JU28_9BACL|nr:hypothetical protein [Sporosarcina highlanderae]MDN4608650.1 hypothetical protein [Sporosarcina highlanderae]
MSAGQGVRRKQRSDKKRQVAPTISMELRDTIYRLNYITGIPVKDVCEAICHSGLSSRKVIEHLSQYFRRDLYFGNTLYRGVPERPPQFRKIPAGKTGRVSTRLRARDYELLSALAYSLDCTPSRATAILLNAAIRDTDFLNSYIREYLRKELDERRMEELRKVLRYLRKNNPYDEDITWTHLLAYIYHEVRDGAQSVAETVNTFINRWK